MGLRGGLFTGLNVHRPGCAMSSVSNDVLPIFDTKGLLSEFRNRGCIKPRVCEGSDSALESFSWYSQLKPLATATATNDEVAQLQHLPSDYGAAHETISMDSYAPLEN